MSLETDEFLDALRDTLLAPGTGIPELTDKAVSVWHAGESDPDDDVKSGIAKTKGVAVLIYDLGGDADKDEDFIKATAAVELFIDASKRNRRVNPELRLGSQIRNSIMRLLHRNADLRNTAAYFDCRVSGYTPLTDPEFVAWRITVSHTLYLEL